MFQVFTIFGQGEKTQPYVRNRKNNQHSVAAMVIARRLHPVGVSMLVLREGAMSFPNATFDLVKSSRVVEVLITSRMSL